MVDSVTFWNRVAAYNETTWPVQVVMIIVAAYLTYRVFAQPGPKTDAWMKLFLAIAFAWNGIVVFLFFLRNPISMYTGTPLFMIVAVLFVVDIFAGRIQFRLPDGKWRKWLTMGWMLLVVAYPLLGLPLGHVYPRMLFPLFPCPLTVFAIALVAAAAPRADKKVFVALLPWALMGLPKCFGALDCYEDCVLFAGGIYGLIVLIREWRAMGRLTRHAQSSLAQEGTVEELI
jgi:hypothetical protein